MQAWCATTNVIYKEHCENSRSTHLLFGYVLKKGAVPGVAELTGFPESSGQAAVARHRWLTNFGGLPSSPQASTPYFPTTNPPHHANFTTPCRTRILSATNIRTL